MNIFEFLSAKLWFWLAASGAAIILLFIAAFLNIKFEPPDKVQKASMLPTILLVVVLWAFFIVSVLCRAWGV